MTDNHEIIVLPDLDKKMDEAIHDAINHFDKKCPYCESLLFTGHIRSKIQIDHYIPISKGGQHVPWNILPVCQKCNLKKLAKKPKLFLTDDKSKICEKYLAMVKAKYVGQVQSDLEKYQQIKSIFSNIHDIASINQTKGEIVKSIYEIVTGKSYLINKPTFKSDFDINQSLIDTINELYKIPENSDPIEKYSATELVTIIQPLTNFTLTRNMVSKAFKKIGFYNRLERINSFETKKAFYVTPKRTFNNGT